MRFAMAFVAILQSQFKSLKGRQFFIKGWFPKDMLFEGVIIADNTLCAVLSPL